jgi:hypothetical protein
MRVESLSFRMSDTNSRRDDFVPLDELEERKLRRSLLTKIRAGDTAAQAKLLPYTGTNIATSGGGDVVLSDRTGRITGECAPIRRFRAYLAVLAADHQQNRRAARTQVPAFFQPGWFLSDLIHALPVSGRARVEFSSPVHRGSPGPLAARGGLFAGRVAGQRRPSGSEFAPFVVAIAGVPHRCR